MDFQFSGIQGAARAAPFEGAGTPYGSGPFEALLLTRFESVQDEVPAWSIYPRARDLALRRLYKKEPIMAGAVYSVVSRLKSMRFVIDGGRNTKKRYSDLFGFADHGKGAGVLFEKTVTDLLTQDNGAFWELYGRGAPDKPLRGPVLAVHHLDAAQCWRTFDPVYPVVYINPYTGSYHRLHHTRVVAMSNFTQPHETARGVGFCAVSRALLNMLIMRDISQYKHEKVGGRFRRGIGYGSGVTAKGLAAALAETDSAADAAGLGRFAGIPFVLSTSTPIDLKVLDLASLPDGFDAEKDMTLYVYAIALAFGVDAREFWPAVTSGATKADAAVQHLKARGKGLADIISTIERAINWYILPEGCEFHFDYADDEQDREVADLHAVKIANVNAMLGGGMITTNEARGLLVAAGVLDPAVLAEAESVAPADSDAPLSDEDVDPGDAPEADQDDASDTETEGTQPDADPVEPIPGERARTITFTPEEIDEAFETWRKLPPLDRVA